MATSISDPTKFGISVKSLRHAVLIGSVPIVCIALAALSSQGILNTLEAPGSYFYATSRFAATTGGLYALIALVAVSLILVGMKRFTIACYFLSFSWAIYFLRSLL